jgi:hypothetical protein
VFAVGASFIAAGDQEESRSTFDHEAADVFGPSNASLFLDLELEPSQRGHLRSKFRRVVLTLTSLRKS